MSFTQSLGNQTACLSHQILQNLAGEGESGSRNFSSVMISLLKSNLFYFKSCKHIFLDGLIDIHTYRVYTIYYLFINIYLSISVM